jgi:hypothetical protein
LNEEDPERGGAGLLVEEEHVAIDQQGVHRVPQAGLNTEGGGKKKGDNKEKMNGQQKEE